MAEDKKKKPKRKVNGQFIKGQPGLSPGRPKGVKIRVQECEDFMAKEGWKLLFTIAKNKQEQARDRIEALELVSAYGYGKPTISAESDSGGDGNALAEMLATLPPAQLLKILDASKE